MTKTFDFESWQAKLVALELANKIGREIMKALSAAPKTPSQLANAMGIPLPTVLFHLARLETAGVVECRRGLGKRLREVKYYKVSSQEIVFKIGGEKNER